MYRDKDNKWRQARGNVHTQRIAPCAFAACEHRHDKKVSHQRLQAVWCDKLSRKGENLNANKLDVQNKVVNEIQQQRNKT